MLIAKDQAIISKYIQEIALHDSQVALKNLYNCYFYELLRYSTLYVSNEQDAEEIISDTFLSVWENRKKIAQLNNFNSYVYRIVRNKSISFFRGKHGSYLSLDNLLIDTFVHYETTPEDKLISEEEVAKINLAINSLPNKCKVAFLLAKESNMKNKEIAELLNISLKTLEAHLTSAVKKVRTAIARGEDSAN